MYCTRSIYYGKQVKYCDAPPTINAPIHVPIRIIRSCSRSSCRRLGGRRRRCRGCHSCGCRRHGTLCRCGCRCRARNNRRSRLGRRPRTVLLNTHLRRQRLERQYRRLAPTSLWTLQYRTRKSERIATRRVAIHIATESSRGVWIVGEFIHSVIGIPNFLIVGGRVPADQIPHAFVIGGALSKRMFPTFAIDTAQIGDSDVVGVPHPR